MMRLSDSDLNVLFPSVRNTPSSRANQAGMVGGNCRVPDSPTMPPVSSVFPIAEKESPYLAAKGEPGYPPVGGFSPVPSREQRQTVDIQSEDRSPAPNQEEEKGNGENGNGSKATPGNGKVQTIDDKGHPSSPQDHGNGSNGKAVPVAPSSDQEPEAVEAERGFLPVLRNRNFLTLWSGQVFSQLADKVYLVLMIAIIVSRFQEADQTISGWVSSVMIAFTIPAVLFGSVAGVFVDRWFKKPVLVATNLLRGALVLVLPPLLWISQGWSPLGPLPIGFCILLVITFVVSTLTQFFAPAEQIAIPLVVERRHLLSANSLYTTTMMASVIVGFAVGEPLLALADAIVAQLGGVFGIGKELVVGGSYAIAGLILLLLRTDEKALRAANATQGEPPHIWQDIRDGIQYLQQQRRVRSALIQLVVLFSVFAALAVLAVRMAEVLPEIKSSQFGFLLAAGGVGMACGAALLGHFGQRFSHLQLTMVGSLGVTGSLVGLSLFSHQLLPTLALLTLLGGFAAIAGIPMQTTIQEETPEEIRGKVFGLQNNAINIALTLPLALAGVAETFLGLQVVFLGLAAMTIAGSLFTWYSSSKA